MSTDHALPPELTIYNVGELLPRMREWLTHDGPVLRIQAQAVSEVDAAGIQLLLSMAKTLEGREARLELVATSSKLSDACEALGVTGLLNWTPAGADHAH